MKELKTTVVWLHASLQALCCEHTSCEETCPRPQSTLDPGGPIAGTQMRSSSYLVLEEIRSHFIINWFHALASPANLLHLQGPRCTEALVHGGDGGGQGASPSENRWMERYRTHTYIYIFAISSAHLYHSSSFSQPAA